MSRSRKKAKRKAQKKLGQESVNGNNTNLETSSNKQSPSDFNVDTLMQTDSTNRLLFPEHQYRDSVPTATISCQNALLEVESAAKFPSAKPMELDLNPIESHLENNVVGKKERKRKRNKRSCAAALTNPQVSLPNAESAVQLLAQEPLQVTLPNAESAVKLPTQDLQGLNMNLADNIEVASANTKQKKRKKKNLNKPTSNVLELESTAKLLAPKHQERDTNLTEIEEKSESGKKSANGKKKRKEKNLHKPASNVIHVESTAEVLVPEHQKRDTNLTEIEKKSESGQKSANGKKKRKKKNLNKPASNVIHAESTAEVLVPEHQERDTNLTEIEEKSESGQKSANGKKKRKTKNLNKPASNVIHVESTADVLLLEHQERETNLTEIEEKSESGQKSANGKKKRKKKNLNKPACNVIHVESTAEVLVPGHQERDTNLTEIEEKSESGQKSANGKKKKKKNLNKPASNVIHVESTAEVLVPEHQERDTSSPNDLVEKTANGRKRKRGENIVKPRSDDQHVELTAQLPPNNQEKKNKTRRRKVKKAANNKVDNVKTATQDSLSSEREGTEALCAGFAKLSPEDVNFVSVQTEHTPNAKETKINCENLENGSYLSFPEKNSVESCSERTHLPSSAEATMHVETRINCDNLENGSCLAFPEKNSVESCSERTHLSSSAEVTMHNDSHLRRKLLILDLNGLLADIVMPAPKGRIADAKLNGRAVFKRPFCDDFLKFCFERFNVAIWSSRSKKIIDRVVDYLLGDLKHKLLFCWDMSHTTMTTFKTLENNQKPLVCKDLRKIWDKHYPDLPWEKGDYDESNTLLLDDSPYKALLNPVHTTLFPHSYTFMHKNDNSLGPGGDLRVYLEKLANAEHVQKYVEEHPFGKNAISFKSANWAFYCRVLKSLHGQAKAKCGGSAESTLLEQGLHVHPGNTMVQLMQ